MLISAISFAVNVASAKDSDTYDYDTSYSGTYDDVEWTSCANSNGDYDDVLGITTAQSSGSYNRVIPGEIMYFNLAGTTTQEIVNPYMNVYSLYGLFSYDTDLCPYLDDEGEDECTFDDGEAWELESYAELDLPSWASGYTIGVTANLYLDGDSDTIAACYFAKMKIVSSFSSDGSTSKMYEGQFDTKDRYFKGTALASQAQAQTAQKPAGSDTNLTIVISIGMLVSIAAFALICVFRHQRLKDEVRHRLLVRRNTAPLVEEDEDDKSVAPGPALTTTNSYGSTPGTGRKPFPNFGNLNVKVHEVKDMSHVSETV